jgi:hypothetical protein
MSKVKNLVTLPVSNLNNFLSREMEETKMKKEMEHQDITSNVGIMNP